MVMAGGCNMKGVLTCGCSLFPLIREQLYEGVAF